MSLKGNVKEYLKQLADLKEEYKDKQQAILRLEQYIEKLEKEGAVIDSVSGGNGGEQHFKIEGFPYPIYTEKKSQLLLRKIKLQELEEKIRQQIAVAEEFINSEPNSRIRRLLTYRYIDELTWVQIAHRMGKNHTADSCQKTLERYLKKYDGAIRDFYAESEYFNQRQRLNYALNDTKIIVRKVFPYVLLGVLIGAVIHNWIPQEFILSILGNNNPFAVILATIIGIPIYADIFGTLPIAEALYLVGVPAGTILALMMAITALSLPSLIMLSQVLQRKLLFLFIGIVSIGIIFVGYVFNFVF